MNGADTTRVIGRLKAAYDKRLSEDTYAVWCEELATLQFPPAWAATIGLIHDSRFFPSISEFLTTYAKHVTLQAGPVDKVQCPHCDDGWQFTDTARNQVVACAHCQAEQYAYQRRGDVPPTKDPPTTAHFERKVDPDVVATVERLRGVRDKLDAMKGLLP